MNSDKSSFININDINQEKIALLFNFSEKHFENITALPDIVKIKFNRFDHIYHSSQFDKYCTINGMCQQIIEAHDSTIFLWFLNCNTLPPKIEKYAITISNFLK